MNIALQNLLTEAGMDIQDVGPRPLAYVILAVVCAYLGSSAILAQRTQRNVQQLWLTLCPLYLLAACNALLHLDTEWVLWARTIARDQNIYELRRLFQLAVLLTSMALLAVGWKSLHRTRSPFTLRTFLLAGACGTLVLHLLRYVSFHYTDLALNFIWLDHSVASWIEFSSIGLVGVGTAMELLRSQGHV
jgi:cytochrome bd-type quinol oxidase subunit 2